MSSTEWDLECLTCQAVHKLDTRDVDVARALAANATAIAGLAPIQGLLSISIDGHVTVDPSWFVAHHTHQLVPINEYGDHDGGCGKRWKCSLCDAEHRCGLLRDHPSGCSVGVPVVSPTR